ncbi:MAG: SCP2 sterol-binding domain-containing protein [Actinomycetota bacterium]|nr:SCP2 sterol-binding domain-containing protein [Actinomycetota bacterium]
MSVKFLSEEWAEALKTALNADEAFRTAAASSSARIQQVITQDGGDTRYWIVIADGTIDMGIGDLYTVDATITESYDSAVALSKGELNAVTAFMTGKIRIAGNMGMLMGLQAALSRLPPAMSSIQTEY